MPTDITIHGLMFSVPERFSAGHVCTQAEAQVLNVALGDKLRNIFSKKVKEAGNPTPESDAAVTLQVDFADAARTYKFGGAAPTLVEREARIIARALAAQHLNTQGMRAEDMGETDLRDLVDTFVVSPHVVAEAERRIEALQAAGAALIPEGLT